MRDARIKPADSRHSASNMRRSRRHNRDPDRELLASWRNGNIVSFAELAGKHLRCIFNIAYRLSGDRDTAGEVTRDTFVAAYRGNAPFPEELPLAHSLISIAIDQCRQQLKRTAATGGTIKTGGPQVAARGNESSHIVTGREAPLPAPGNHAAEHEKIQECLSQVHTEYRELLVLRDVHGFAYGEMGDILGTPADEARSRLFLAREKLHGCMWKTMAWATDSPGPATGSAEHAEVRRKLNLCMENVVARAEKESIRRHLATCGSCRHFLVELEWTIGQLRGLPKIAPPPGLDEQIIVRLHKERTPHPEASFFRGLSYAAVALLMLGTTGYLVARKSARRPEPAPPAVTPSRQGSVPTVLPPAAPQSSGPQARLPLPAPSIAPPPQPPAQAGSSPTAQQAAGEAAQSPPPPTARTLQKSAERERKTNKGDDLGLKGTWGGQMAPNLPLRREGRKVYEPPPAEGEEVYLIVKDPVAAAGAIETAVTGTGGKVIGRAYSGGRDILYTTVEMGKFAEVISRLERVGKIRERPRQPEGGGNMVELIIRW